MLQYLMARMSTVLVMHVKVLRRNQTMPWALVPVCLAIYSLLRLAYKLLASWSSTA